jgi:phosphoglycerol geranylgeranyltransferase
MSKNNLLKEMENLENGLAILVDPDKFISMKNQDEWIRRVNFLSPDFLFIGGSVVAKSDFDKCVELLNERINIPLIIFPGNYDQVHPLAKGLLFLSLLSGQNPEYLITQHVKAVEYIVETQVEIIPTAYLLIDGGIQTAVAYVSQTQPIPTYGKTIAAKIALAGKYQGKKLIYLDAGSGALNIVPEEMIQEVKNVGLPLIVGGGMKTITDIEKSHRAGANVIVIGNKIEEDLDFFLELSAYRNRVKSQHSF